MEQDAVYQLTNMEAMKPKEAMEPNRLKEGLSWKPDGAVHDDTEGIRAQLSEPNGFLVHLLSHSDASASNRPANATSRLRPRMLSRDSSVGRASD